MIKLSLENRLQPIKYILTPDNKIQPVTDIVDFTVDNSPLVTTALHSINELGKQLLKAAGDGNTQEVKNLLTQGSPFTSDWLGTSPLHLAAQNNNVDVCDVLLRGGISKDARNKVDRTPLHLAAFEGYYQVAETLIKHGSDVNCKDMLNMTPLHWAVQNGHTAVVELLVRNGAQINIKNKFDLTPQRIALQINKLEIVELLQAYEGDPQAATQNLMMQLGTEGLDNDVVEVQDNSNSSNEVTEGIDPVIINLDDHIAGIDQQSTSDDPVIINLCNDGINDNDQGTNKDPLIINLLNDVSDEIQQDCEKGNTMPALMDSTSATNFKIIDGVIHPVDEDTENSFSAAQLLQEHGITMIPNDTEETNILNTVMESGHSVVLTDVGKEVLNSVKQLEDKVPPHTSRPKKIIKVSPEEFLSLTNGQFIKNMSMPSKYKVIPVKSNTRRIVMKKNRPIPYGNMIKVQTVINKSNNNKTELEYYMDQLAEAKKTIEEYKAKLRRKEMEVDRYKMQLRLLMNPNPS